MKVKRLLESIGGAKASARFKEGLAALETEEKALRAERIATEAELEDRVGLGEDPAGLAEKLLTIDQKLRALPLRRGPLTKHLGEAEASEARRLAEEKRATWAAQLQEKREAGRRLHNEVVSHFHAALVGLVRLDVLEREALKLGNRCGDLGFDFEADPSRIAQEAMRRVLKDLPPWVATARFGEVAIEPLVFNVYRRVLPAEAPPELPES